MDAALAGATAWSADELLQGALSAGLSTLAKSTKVDIETSRFKVWNIVEKVEILVQPILFDGLVSAMSCKRSFKCWSDTALVNRRAMNAVQLKITDRAGNGVPDRAIQVRILPDNAIFPITWNGTVRSDANGLYTFDDLALEVGRKKFGVASIFKK